MTAATIPGTPRTPDPWEHRVDAGDWDAITQEVNEYGGALLPQLLTTGETVEIRQMYDRDDLFRSTVDMGQHRFGEGRYRYFRTPYPEPVEQLKQALYPRLLPIARDWWTKLGRPAPWPARAVGPRLVRRPCAARRLRDPIREAAHARPRLPRRRMIAVKTYGLVGTDGLPHQSPTRRPQGDHLRTRACGRPACPAALHAIARAGHVKHRVSFPGEPPAFAVGFRPCRT
jgi:hypothetical protein